MGEEALQGPENKIHMVASEAQLGAILHHPGEVLFNDKAAFVVLFFRPWRHHHTGTHYYKSLSRDSLCA